MGELNLLGDYHKWVVETSHMVNVSEYYMAADLEGLKSIVQYTARKKKRRPIIGPLEFTHFIRDGNEYLSAHFRHHTTGKKLRFMRLRREN